MSNLTGPAAVAAAALPNSETAMADIIDSLKRLERIGSENSKTVEKIIAAAREIEAKIVEQYAQRSDEISINSDEILKKVADTKGISISDAARSLGVPVQKSSYPDDDAEEIPVHLSYEIDPERKKVFRRGGRHIDWVSGSRDGALAFSKDLSNGLLAIIAEDLSSQSQANEEALAILEKAKQKSIQIVLSLKPVAHSQNRADPESKQDLEYEALGMPDGERALIARFGDNAWRILRMKDGHPAENWEGNYMSAQNALIALQEKLSRNQLA